MKRLQIHGFKSFAQNTVLEFEPGITAIVGPNGSGKSNVADCVRWVLGEQSTKQLRGKKSEDVIFAGSDKRSRSGFAEVVATFDNADRRIPVDVAEVSIGRRVDRTGESEYLINGGRVRLLDIIDLVLKSNIGTSRYTVIGQGTIDQLILAGPLEIKSLLDEASGVKTYHVRREKTLKRLEQTAQNLMRAEDVVNELEPRLKSLRRQAKRMEAREGLELELKLLLRERLSSAYYGFSQEVSALQEKLGVLGQERQALHDKLSEGQAQLERESASSTHEITRVATIRRDLLSLQEQKNKLLEQRSIVQGKLASARSGQSGDPRALQVQAQQLESKLRGLTDELVRIREQLARHLHEENEFRTRREAVSVKLDQLYRMLSQPESVDRHEFDATMQAMEQTVDKLLEEIERAEDVQTVRALVLGFKNIFNTIKTRAHALLGGSVEQKTRQEELQMLHSEQSRIEQQLSLIGAERASAETSVKLLEAQEQALLQEQLDVRLELQKASSHNGVDAFVESLTKEAASIDAQVFTFQGNIRALEENLASLDAQESARRSKTLELERGSRVLQDAINAVRDQESALAVEKARFDTLLGGVSAEIIQVFGQELAAEIMRTAQPSSSVDLEDKIAKVKHQLELIGGVDEMTMQEFRETELRFNTLTDQIADLKRSMEDLRQVMDELDEHIKRAFNEAFHRINERFEHYFRVLFNGGRAQMVLVKSAEEAAVDQTTQAEDSVDSDESQMRPEERLLQKYESNISAVVGVDIRATPPGKKLSSLQALSGGERALTSIALLCSLLACFPSPFVVLDEVDAALDEANTIRFGQILGTLSHQTQFVTITHNRETMAQSKTLYGVSMGDDSVSKILSLKFDQATAYAK